MPPEPDLSVTALSRNSPPTVVASAALPSVKTTTTPPLAADAGASAAASVLSEATDPSASCCRALAVDNEGAFVLGPEAEGEAGKRECTGAGRVAFEELRSRESFASGVHDHSVWTAGPPDGESISSVRSLSTLGPWVGRRRVILLGLGWAGSATFYRWSKRQDTARAQCQKTT